MELKCFICNQNVFRTPSQVKFRTNTFCSQKCYAVEKSRRWKGKNNPGFNGGNLEIKCKVCGKQFTSKSYGEKRNSKLGACSLKCGNTLAGIRRAGENHWAWNGGLGRITKPIRAKKKYKDWMNSVLERDNKTCQVCGSLDNLEIHHKKELAILVKEYIAKYKTLDSYNDYFYDKENGITLCRDCHMMNHKKQK
jgi:endogenous inhibitor of DNA gyrase (YacG/DUF329 family)